MANYVSKSYQNQSDVFTRQEIFKILGLSFDKTVIHTYNAFLLMKPKNKKNKVTKPRFNLGEE